MDAEQDLQEVTTPIAPVSKNPLKSGYIQDLYNDIEKFLKDEGDQERNDNPGDVG